MKFLSRLRRRDPFDEVADRVASLVGDLRGFRKHGTAHQQPEYEELRKIGQELHEQGGLELMRKVAHKMAPRVSATPSPYAASQEADSLSDINDYWDGIGGWMG